MGIESASHPCFVEPLERRTMLSAQLVYDVNGAPGSGDPVNAVQANGLTFFVADDGVHGSEVWRTDGTPQGTFLLRDIVPGAETSAPVLLGARADRATFQVNGGAVWESDGTSEGTSPDFNPSTPALKSNTTVSASAGNSLYFASFDRLYIVRPSRAVNELKALGSNVIGIVIAGAYAYAVTEDRNLWVTDGTTAGTRILKNLRTSGSHMAAVGGTLYFPLFNSQTAKYELWKSQGTDATTSLVKTLSPGVVRSMAAVGQTIFLMLGVPDLVHNSNGDLTLWKSDGTTDGTVPVKAIGPDSPLAAPLQLVPAGSRVYFADFAATPNLWGSDGTPDGTLVLKAGAVTPPFGRTSMLDFGGTLLFHASDAATGGELWRTDGTPEGTRPVADLVPGPTSSGPQPLGVAGGRAVFSALDPARGRELWVTDATPDATGLLADLNTGTAGAFPSRPVELNGKLLFTASATSLLPEFHVMDLTGGGPPVRLTLGEGGPALRSTDNLTRVGNLVYFNGRTATTTTPFLFVTDGTPAGTRAVRSLAGINNPGNFRAVGDRLYFVGGNFGSQTLYTSDGTDTGTVALATGFGFIGESVDRGRWAAYNGKLYFVGQGASGGDRLWVSDGTPAGTAPVGNTPAASYLTVADNRLYFLGPTKTLHAFNGTSVTSILGQYSRIHALGDRLILVNASSSGDAMLVLRPGDTSPVSLSDVVIRDQAPVRVGKWLYFVASVYGNLGQVWRTDGTPSGTMLAAEAFDAQSLTTAGHLVYYTDRAGAIGRELWASGGTPPGTYLVADLFPGLGTAWTVNLVETGGVAYFSAIAGGYGRELWRAVDDVAPSVASAAFDPAGTTPSAAITFTENVGTSLNLADWKLTDRATGADVSHLLASFSFDADANVARLVLTADMPVGDYRLELAAGAAVDPVGNASTTPLALDFHHLPGDINRDRAIDFADLVILAQNYGATGRAFATGDLTGDGDVDFDDLVVLAQRYNSTLPELPANPPAVGLFNSTSPIARRPAARKGR